MRRGPWRGLKGRWWLLVVAVACGAALLLEIVLLASGPNFVPPGTTTWATGSEVSVLDVDLIATYQTANASDTNFMVQSDCGCEPVHVVPGGSFPWWVRVANTDPVNHTLLRLTVDSPFVLLETNPATPAPIPAGGAVNLTMYVQVPATGGSWELTGAIWVM